MIRFAVLPLFACALLLSACGDSGAARQPAETAAPTAGDWLLESEPADAMGVAQAKASVEPGDAIVLRARIGGRMEPISKDSAAFTVMDLSVPHCGELHGDGCPTPWDYCCAAPERITKNAATVQMVDAGGNAAAVSPIEAGLAALDEVVVVGTVGPRPSPDVLTVKASSFYRVGP